MNESDGEARPGAWRRLVDNPYLLLAFASLCWSGNHIVGRAIGGHVPPLGISTVRWLIPVFILWPFARPHLQKDWPQVKAHWGMMLWLGLTGGALFSALQYVGLQYTTALNVSVLNSLVPVLIVLAGTILFRDRISMVQAMGIAVSLSGVLVIVTRASLDALVNLAFSRGDLIILINMAVFSIYAAYLRLRPKIHGLSFIFLLSAISVVGTFPFFVAEELSGFTFQPTLETFIAIAYVSIFPSVLAFAAWNRGVEIIGANRSGPFLHLVPIFTATLGSIILGEHLAAYHVIGFVLILSGVWLASTNPRLGKAK
jgi:drug/metabolite transporter (DMT)-like permease